jgi:hypothetical protein
MLGQQHYNRASRRQRCNTRSPADDPHAIIIYTPSKPHVFQAAGTRRLPYARRRCMSPCTCRQPQQPLRNQRQTGAAQQTKIVACASKLCGRRFRPALCSRQKPLEELLRTHGAWDHRFQGDQKPRSPVRQKKCIFPYVWLMRYTCLHLGHCSSVSAVATNVGTLLPFSPVHLCGVGC